MRSISSCRNASNSSPTYAGYLGPGLVLIGAGLVLMGLTEPISLALAPHGPTTSSGISWAVRFFGGLA